MKNEQLVVFWNSCFGLLVRKWQKNAALISIHKQVFQVNNYRIFFPKNLKGEMKMFVWWGLMIIFQKLSCWCITLMFEGDFIQLNFLQGVFCFPFNQSPVNRAGRCINFLVNTDLFLCCIGYAFYFVKSAVRTLCLTAQPHLSLSSEYVSNTVSCTLTKNFSQKANQCQTLSLPGRTASTLYCRGLPKDSHWKIYAFFLFTSTSAPLKCSSTFNWLAAASSASKVSLSWWHDKG